MPYSMYNLEAFISLARVGDRVSIDIVNEHFNDKKILN